MQVAVLRQPVAIAFGGPPEERLVLEDRSAETGAEIAPVLAGVLDPLDLREEVRADERARTQLREGGAAERIRAGLGGRIEHAAARAAHLGIVGMDLDADILEQSARDVIVAFSTPAAHAAKDATRSIPIIVARADPLATGL